GECFGQIGPGFSALSLSRKRAAQGTAIRRGRNGGVGVVKHVCPRWSIGGFSFSAGLLLLLLGRVRLRRLGTLCGFGPRRRCAARPQENERSQAAGSKSRHLKEL